MHSSLQAQNMMVGKLRELGMKTPEKQLCLQRLTNWLELQCCEEIGMLQAHTLITFLALG